MNSLLGSHQKKILVAPLDWGLGHATRCIPIISYLLEKNCKVTIASEGMIQELLKKEFPHANFIPLRGYRIRYPKKGKLFMPLMLLQIPKILRAIWHEQAWIKKKATSFDLIISDNRYGFYSKNITSILITHQIQVLSGWGKFPDWCLRMVIMRLILNFDACWIPDDERNDGIAGKLSHPRKLPITCRFIGPISRLTIEPAHQKSNLLVLLSGPEPQRTFLEKKLISALTVFGKDVLFVRGKDTASPLPKAGEKIRFENHLDATMLCKRIGEADLVICRSGYSSVMDLLKMEKKALLIPTPGQTEQVYLAERLAEMNWFAVEKQETLNLDRGIKKAMELNITNRPVFDFEGFRQALFDLDIQ